MAAQQAPRAPAWAPAFPGPRPQPPRAHLGQVLDFDHVVVGVSPEHSLPLAGHVHVVLHGLCGHGHAPGGQEGQHVADAAGAYTPWPRRRAAPSPAPTRRAPSTHCGCRRKLY